MWAQDQWDDDPERWDEPDDGEALPADAAVARAKPRIVDLFGPGTGRLLYQIQIAVILERELFHWITLRALRELEEERADRRVPSLLIIWPVTIPRAFVLRLIETRPEYGKYLTSRA